MKEVKSESSIKTFQLHKNYRKRIISAGEFEISDLKLPKETGAERCFAVDKKKQEEYHFVKGKTLGIIIGGWCFFVTLFCCITGVYSTDMRTMILNICTPVVLIVLGMILPIIRQAQDRKEKGN